MDDMKNQGIGVHEVLSYLVKIGLGRKCCAGGVIRNKVLAEEKILDDSLWLGT